MFCEFSRPRKTILATRWSGKQDVRSENQCPPLPSSHHGSDKFRFHRYLRSVECVRRVLLYLRQMRSMTNIDIGAFDRAMLHTERGYATLSRPSVCPSACDYTLITWWNEYFENNFTADYLRFWLGLTSTSAICMVQREHPKISGGMSGGQFLSRKPAMWYCRFYAVIGNISETKQDRTKVTMTD